VANRNLETVTEAIRHSQVLALHIEKCGVNDPKFFKALFKAIGEA